MPTFLTPLLRSSAEGLCLQNVRTQAILADRLEGAFDSATRRTGLLGRDSFAEGSAMIIAPSNAIHTWFMRFPIDVAFVRKDGGLVKIRSAVPPWRMTAALGAYAVIELPAGALARTETMAGDRVAIVPRANLVS